ncbi:type IX secretion system membrane protein PorP/SprF, partial [Fulvivirga sp. RKSG066]|uniref:PorP/SprF family type IX secretion system membrane protein n=1 Tax=Fulvivirga aurantia TaxID=2529383 RepID=UPI0012BC1D79
MKNIKITLVILLLTVGFASYGQQQVMFTQYMFNGLALNPAYAGSHEAISVTAMAREQWTGIDGAPSTQTLSIHSPVFNNRIGLGLLVLHDKIGVTEQTGAYASYSYKIPFVNGSSIALGLQGGFTSYDARFSEVSETNPVFATGDVREFHPNVGFGAYYTTDKFYAGVSAPQLIETAFDKDNEDSDAKIVRHYFAQAGYVLDIDQNLKLKPNVLVKAVDGAPLQIDLNANLLINEVIWVGVSWRSFDSFDALFQLQVTEKLQFGYAYDFATTTDLR